VTRRIAVLASVLGIALASNVASAHVAPSVDDNNRYLKIAPLGDRVRLAYTVFYGEIPGASMRPKLDADHNGTISDAEAKAFGKDLGDQVQATLELEIDGQTVPVTWTTVDVGLGTPDVNAGSFSVDLVAYACLPTARGQHHIVVRDRFRIPHPGETEAKVDDTPGVTIDRARVGQIDDARHDFLFPGPGGPLEDDGLDVTFTAGDRAPVSADGKCTGTPSTRSRTPFLIGLVLVAGAVGALVFVRNRVRGA
jgi:hypothetical protein